MPDADATRKRSRSPSESDEQQQQNKRPNTGVEQPSRVKPEEDQVSAASSPIAPAPEDTTMTAAAAAEGTGTDGDGDGTSAAAGTAAGDAGAGATPPIGNIHMRCLIVTQDASIIIGKGGNHVNEIREKSGAKVMVSESLSGNPERVLNVSGPLDAVSKAFGLIVRRINDEPFDKPSVPGSRAVTIKFMIPNSRMGSVIGKGGSKIKEIQEASGAKLNASEGMLPGSTERVLSVSGVADAIHIATYYVGNILIEANERHPTSARETIYRPASFAGGAGGAGAGGNRRPPVGGAVGGGGAPYGAPPPYATGYPPMPQQMPAANPYAAPPMPPPGTPLQTQQIYIPNDLVGCIIGKGGSKINEIRQMSASTIKIMEPGTNASGQPGAGAGSEHERLVVITGAPANIQMAVSMLYTRLEQEKQKQLRQQQV